MHRSSAHAFRRGLRCNQRCSIIRSYKPDERLVRNKVQQLLREDWDQEQAERAVAICEQILREKGATELQCFASRDPYSHPALVENQTRVRILASQAFYATIECLLASGAAWHVHSHNNFEGRCLDTIVHREALREIARASPVESVTKVQSAIEWLKGNSELPPKGMDNYPKVHDKGDSIVKMSTAESLAVLLILDEARVKHGFSEEQLGVSSAEAETIAHVFATYATHTDGRMDWSELQQLCAHCGLDLSAKEGQAAVQAISDDGNRFIDFSEFAGFWVNPSEAVADLRMQDL